MGLPGFTAEASLYRKDAHYRAAAAAHDPAGAGLVTPQQRRTWIECRSGWHGGKYYLCCVNYRTGEFICREQTEQQRDPSSN